MSKTTFIITLIITAVLAVIFYHHPQIDLRVAEKFYTVKQGFVWAHTPWAWDFRYALYTAVWATLILAFSALVLKLCMKRAKLPGVRASLYVIAVFVLVPLLLINVVFKDHFHRPRPRDVAEFSGVMTFQPPWSISGQCDTNCSFVSGDPAVMFSFWLFLPFFRKKSWRYAYGSAILLLGAFYGLIRIGQGGHFFTDVVFAGLLTYLGVWVVHYGFYREVMNTNAK